MPWRWCLGWAGVPCGLLCHGSRCPEHQAQAAAAATRVERERRPYSHAERVRRAETVAAWVAEHGYVCPGWGRQPHQAVDLAADHVHGVGAGGAEDGPLSVLCASCNGRKGKTAGQSPAPPPYVVRME